MLRTDQNSFSYAHFLSPSKSTYPQNVNPFLVSTCCMRWFFLSVSMRMERLYAVGTDSMGVLFSETKAYVTYGGAALGWAFTSGRLVGGYIAESLQ